MKTRMQPIGNAWAKLPRIVRDLSVDLNKKIDLNVDDKHCFFTKRSPGLEWGMPIRVASYSWSAWKFLEIDNGEEVQVSRDLGPI